MSSKIVKTYFTSTGFIYLNEYYIIWLYTIMNRLDVLQDYFLCSVIFIYIVILYTV